MRSRQAPELSVCIIARNEEPRIGECLRGLKRAGWHIVVVDTGSTDRTREVAHRCGAQVFEMPWPDSFAEARNASLRHALGRWILWVDADDVVDSAFLQGVTSLIRGCPERNRAFHVAVRIPPGPGQYSWGIVDHVKLFPNVPTLRFEHRIHEQIIPSLRDHGIPVEWSDLYVTHKNYDRSPEGQALKRRRDFRLLHLDLLDRPEHAFTLFNLGMTYHEATRDFVVAANYLRRSLAVSHPADSIFARACTLLAESLLGQGEVEEALVANEFGRQFYPEEAQLLLQAGTLYTALHKFDQARQSLELLVTGRDRIGYRSTGMDLRTCQGPRELAMLYHLLGDSLHAEEDLRRVAVEYPEYVPARESLVEVLAAQGKKMESRRFLNTLPPESFNRPEIRNIQAAFAA